MTCTIPSHEDKGIVRTLSLQKIYVIASLVLTGIAYAAAPPENPSPPTTLTAPNDTNIHAASNLLSHHDDPLSPPLTAESTVIFRIPDSSLTLRITTESAQPISRAALGTTLLSMRARLRAFIRLNGAGDTPLRPGDDPYESSPQLRGGCFIGVATWPPGAGLMTYGAVNVVLQGLFLFLYQERRSWFAVFEVKDDQFGVIGIGKVTTEQPARS
ncbi:MAG: hypothetical protein Q9222_004855 [Ikaeria aurantiellina]